MMYTSRKEAAGIQVGTYNRAIKRISHKKVVTSETLDFESSVQYLTHEYKALLLDCSFLDLCSERVCAEVYFAHKKRRSSMKSKAADFSLRAILNTHSAHPKRKRLIPNAEVVIKNHNLGHRDIPIRINKLGLRGPQLPKAKRQRVPYFGARRFHYMGRLPL